MKGHIHPGPKGFQPALHDLLGEFLVAVILVQKSKEREQRHLNLLWQRQAGSVIEGDATAICYHTIDELDLFRMKCQSPIASIQFPAELPQESFAIALSNILSW